MSGYFEVDSDWIEARMAAERVFPADRAGRYFRDAAKQLSKQTGESYECCLNHINGHAVSAATDIFLAAMGEDR